MSTIAKIIVLLVLTFLTIGLVEARNDKMYEDIENISMSFSSDNISQIVTEIDYFVKTNVSYKYHKKPQKLKNIWNRNEGDCTDYASLIAHMLGYHGIETRFRHGFVKYNGTWRGKHDWYEYNLNGTWINPELKGLDAVNDLGGGFW